jgi:hypothetical protein
MKNIAIKVMDQLFIVVYGTGNPSDEEWERYLDLVARHGVELTVQLISTDGGEPTGAQRRRLNAMLGGRMVPVAVVSDKPSVLRTVSVLSWFNRKIKAFPASALDEALAHLEIPKSRATLIAKEIGLLRAELGQGHRATA